MRKLDSKFHIEGDQIVKTSNGDPIPEDEPLFLIRARDYLALPLLHEYRRMCIQDGCTDYQIKGNDEMILAFEKWAEKNRAKMKQPGITRGL